MIGIITKRNKDKTFDDVGMSNRYLTRGITVRSIAKTISEEWIKEGVRVELFYDDRLHLAPFNTIYYNCPDLTT
jgi:hypothetical protein